MLRIDRLCIYVIIFGLISLIPSIDRIKFLDELSVMALGCIAFIDCIFNNAWRKYSALWIVMAILAFYAIYSIAYVNNNVPEAILTDWVIEQKPYIPLLVLLGIGPKLNHVDRRNIKIICWINAAICVIALLGGSTLTRPILFHTTYGGNIIFISSIYILYCSIDSHGQISNTTIKHVVTLLICGLLCTRSKYYGIFIISLYFIFVYKPGVTKHLTLPHIATLCTLLLVILSVSWSKINYYFISGNAVGTSFDPTVIDSFARPVLYTTGWFILWDYFPFGSGLASLATYASQIWYSDIYYQYGINQVHGLSQKNPAFICDAYYPSLAQFGFIGLILFIIYWCYIYGFLRKLIRKNPILYKYPFIIGSLIICFVLIECIAGNAITQNIGVVSFMLLGLICANATHTKAIHVESTNTYSSLIKRKI